MVNNWSGRRAVVTGGAGFIGSNLVQKLLASDATVVVLDNFSSGFERNLDFSDSETSTDKLSIVRGDIRDISVLSSTFADTDTVFHLAALSSVPASIADPALAHDVNTTGSLNVMETARQCNVRRVVVSASAAAYGSTSSPVLSESITPDPLSPYASSKLAMEHYAKNYTELFDLPTAILRYFNVFGPHQDPQSMYAAVVPIFVYNLLSGQRPTIYGDGEQTRDFIHVDDVVRANLLAADTPNSACGKPVNIAGGEGTSVNELYAAIAELLDSDIKPQYTAERPGDIRHSVADVNAAKNTLDFTREISIRDGLSRSIDWYKSDYLRKENAL